jgi:hypothetical protein
MSYLSELLAVKAALQAIEYDFAGLRVIIAFRKFAEKANFNPNQPRLPRGQAGGGRWTGGATITLIQSRQGSGIVRIVRNPVVPTPAQAARLRVAEIESLNATNLVRTVEPNWRAPRSLTETVEGLIAHHRGIRDAANARYAELMRGHNSPPERIVEPSGQRTNEVFHRPLGFRNEWTYLNYREYMTKGVRSAGYTDAILYVRGSSVTGFSYKTKLYFDVNRTSDIDIAIVSPILFETMTAMGLPTMGNSTRTFAFEANSEIALRLGLEKLLVGSDAILGRDTTFMVYRNKAALESRGPYITLTK